MLVKARVKFTYRQQQKCSLYDKVSNTSNCIATGFTDQFGDPVLGGPVHGMRLVALGNVHVVDDPLCTCWE